MRTLQESRQRWQAFFKTYNSTSLLRQDILRKQHTTSPGDVAIRSLCWKLFFYLPDLSPSTWSPVITSSRDVFTTLRTKFLEPLVTGNIAIFLDQDNEAPVDPLAEDPSNPWSRLRKDEELRKEILQDVQRCMPDHDYFRSAKVQKQMLDILFVYSKLNEDTGYRQGMHEIVAPLLWVVSNDAVKANVAETPEDDQHMLQVLDPAYIEHDTFSLFQAVMHSARTWYELGEDAGSPGSKRNAPIIEKSRTIHESLLMAVDPQLAWFLKKVEILPQVFLIRWIRLIFGREFPLEHLLVLWDSLFAEDPDLTLVDYICVAMLLRIRWELFELDHTLALTLLLRYPHPKPPHLPATFVSDAIYLRDHLSPSGGAYIISKYSNKPPVPASLVPLPWSPFSSPSRRTRETGSSRCRSVTPLSGTTAKLTQVQGGFDKFANNLAKGVVDTGKVWDLNKTFSRVIDDLNRKVEGFQHIDTRGHKTPRGGSLDSAHDSQQKATTAMEERNEMLALALEKSYVELESIVGDRPELKPTLGRIRLVQTYLQGVGIEIDRANLLSDLPSRAPISNLDTDLPLLITHPWYPQSDIPITPNDGGVSTTPTPLQTSLPPLSPSSHSPPTFSRIMTTQNTSNTTILSEPQHRSPSSSPFPPSSQLKQNPQASLTASPSNAALSHKKNKNQATSTNYSAEHISIACTQQVRPSLAHSAFAWMLGEHSLVSENCEYHGSEVGLPTAEGGSNDHSGRLFGAEEGGSMSGRLNGTSDENRAMLFGV